MNAPDSERDAPGGRDALATAFTVFAFLWAMATLYHQAQFKLWTESLPNILMSAAAFAVVLRPGSTARFAALLVLQLVTYVQSLPDVPNHWVFTAYANLTILAAMGLVAVRRAGLDRGEIYRRFAPAVRAELLILYAFAVFHKLNVDYFDPAVSCGEFIYLELLQTYPFLPDAPWAGLAATWGALAIEAAIPVLLLFRVTRSAGVIVAAVFHYFLGVGSYYNFSSMLFGAYFLFLPDDAAVRIREWWRASAIRERLSFLERPEVRREARRWLARAFGVGVALAAVLVTMARLSWTADSAVVEWVKAAWPPIRALLAPGFLVLWSVYGAALLGIYLACRRRLADRRGAKELLALPSPSLVLFVALVFINGASPYLGLKTEQSFAMFSNLRTEGGETNHLLLDDPLYLADYQADIVEIVETSDPDLQQYADRGVGMTFFEFRSHLAGLPADRQDRTSVTYRRNGRLHRVDRVAADPTLSSPPPVLARKLLSFRPVELAEHVRCRH